MIALLALALSPRCGASSVQITTAGLIDGNSGRCIVRTASGNLYAVIPSASGILVYESTNNGGAWTQEDAAHEPAGKELAAGAGIDGNGLIDIAYLLEGNRGAGSLRFVTFSTATNAFSGDSSVASAGILGTPRVALAVDSNNAPHVLYEDFTRSLATVTYVDKVGGSWNSRIQVFGAPTSQNGCMGDILIDQNNLPQISYLDCDSALEI